MKFIITISLLISCFSLQAQRYEEVIYFKNGTVLKGNIIEQNNETIKIEIIGGSILVFSVSETEKVTKEKIDKENELKADFLIKEKGYYHTITTGFLPGNDGIFAFGYSMHYTVGYQPKKNLNLAFGLGIGSDFYTKNSYRELHIILPTYLEARLYQIKKPFTPYYCLQIGYGTPLMTTEWGVIDTQGGLYFHPKIGLRFASRKKTCFVTEIGYSSQRVTYSFDQFSAIYREFKAFNRVSLRFGLLF